MLARTWALDRLDCLITSYQFFHFITVVVDFLLTFCWSSSRPLPVIPSKHFVTDTPGSPAVSHNPSLLLEHLVRSSQLVRSSSLLRSFPKIISLDHLASPLLFPDYVQCISHYVPTLNRYLHTTCI